MKTNPSLTLIAAAILAFGLTATAQTSAPATTTHPELVALTKVADESVRRDAGIIIALAAKREMLLKKYSDAAARVEKYLAAECGPDIPGERELNCKTPAPEGLGNEFYGTWESLVKVSRELSEENSRTILDIETARAYRPGSVSSEAKEGFWRFHESAYTDLQNVKKNLSKTQESLADKLSATSVPKK